MNPNEKKTTDSTTQTIDLPVEETTADEAGKVAGGTKMGTRQLVEEGGTSLAEPTNDGQFTNI